VSRFLSSKYKDLTPYVPGEQPKDRRYIKLNTNENPFPPSPRAQALTAEAAAGLQLYSDPECTLLVEKAAQYYGIDRDEIIFTNGSDEMLNFAFMTFCDDNRPAVFPDITYGFYSVFAELNHIPYTTIPLRDDFSVGVEDYLGLNKTIFLANPNAPTGLALPMERIEAILQSNPNNIVVIDEAYADFNGESAVPLIHKYENLLVIQTFSKSRSMAGARLGLGIGCKALIRNLNVIKYSTNPYNVNSMTMAAGIGSLEDTEYFKTTLETILQNREWTANALKALGFSMTESRTNFLFVTHPKLDGAKLYQQLKDRGILVRFFNTPRLKDYNRITIGSKDEMQVLVTTIKEILEEST
jgi:histidinol-phosphate aminotransferase